MKTLLSNFRVRTLSALALATAACLSVSSVNAQQPLPREAAARPQATAPQAEIPACLSKLKLTEQQQTQIKEIVRDYDADLTAVWGQFGERYMETVRTEAMLLAAIEDHLTEPQRSQVREQRRQTAQHKKAEASTDGKPNQAQEQPANADDVETALAAITLTDEQETAADQLHQKCHNQLRSLNRDIDGLHTRLVSLEADKLVEIEKVLTPEQLQQLRETRQDAPIAAKVTAAKIKNPAQAE